MTASPSGDGVVLTIIRADQFLENLLPHDKTQLQIRLTDVKTQQLIYSTFLKPDTPTLWQQKLVYGQREFLLATAPSPAYLAQHRGWQSSVVLAASVLGTGLLGAFLMLGTGYTARVETQVEEKIAELSESTEKLTGLYALSPLGIALSDMNGRFIDFNESFRRISGYSTAELTQLDYKSLSPAKFESIDAAQLAHLKLHGRYGPYEKEFINKDGSVVPVSLNGLLLHGKNGEQHVWSIVEDISSRLKAGEALRDSEERWKFALEGAGEGVWDWNLQTGELFLSKQEMVVLGYESEDAQWTNISTRTHLIHPQDIAIRKAAMEDYFACKAPIYTCEFRTRTQEGRWKWILARGMLVSHTADGQPLRMIGTHSDINKAKRMQSKEAMRSTVMEMLAHGARLREILDIVIATLEAENDELVYAIFNNNDEEERHTLAGTGLPLLWYPKQPEIGVSAEDPAQSKSTEDQQSLPSPNTIQNGVIPSAGVELCRSELIMSDGGFIEGILVSFRKFSGSKALPDAEQQQQAAALIGIAIQHKRIEEQLLLANSVYMASSEAIMVVDTDNHIVAVNPAFETITGFNLREVVGRDPKFMQTSHQSTVFYQAMWQAISATGSWHGEMWNQRKNGSIYPLNMHISSIHGEDGLVLRRIAIFTDITEKKLAEEQINHLAHYDLLTNLPNRALYADRLSQALATARRNETHLALLYVDLDKFKPVNDSLGHAVGDGLLKQVAQRMLACVRESDTIARIGGDEFVAILASVQTEQNARQVGEKIRSALEAPFIVDGHPISISASIGGALYPEHGEDKTQLMQNADSAMYSAKKSGRNTVHIFGQSDV